jgi:hypothetical protein
VEKKCGALVEWYWQGNRCVELWWNYIDRGTEAWNFGGIILTGE